MGAESLGHKSVFKVSEILRKKKEQNKTHQDRIEKLCCILNVYLEQMPEHRV